MLKGCILSLRCHVISEWKRTCLVVGCAGVAVVEGGPAVPRSGDAGVADVAATARVVAVVDEDRLALVLLGKYFRYST